MLPSSVRWQMQDRWSGFSRELLISRPILRLWDSSDPAPFLSEQNESQPIHPLLLARFENQTIAAAITIISDGMTTLAGPITETVFDIANR